MAFETGTASSHTDLFAKLKTFLTTNADLVAADQAWTVAWSAPGGAPNTTDIVLQGPGLAGDDIVLVGLSLTADVAGDSYVLWSRGMTGVLAEGVAIVDHTNRSNVVGMYLDPNPMTYWFVANGRRFVAVVKISTVYEAMYGGFYLAYALPAVYPYPLFIGGSRGDFINGTASWRSSDSTHTHFTSPSTLNSAPPRDSQAYLLDPAAQWIRGFNNGVLITTPTFAVGPEQFYDGLGVARASTGLALGYDLRTRIGQGFDGSFTLTPFTLNQQVPIDQSFGVLDGCFYVGGLNNAAENIVTVGGVDHLVVQNTFRTGTGDYWALRLE